MSNLDIWNQFETTDTRFTKKMDTGAKLTSINPEWQIKQFTEQFGPCGQGWGFSVTYSEIVEGAVMMHRDLNDADGQPINFGPSKVHTARIELWYMSGGERRAIEGTGHTRFVYMTKWGPTTDEEYEKKSITDGLTKAMSMLGMGGDVRMGQFDDREYVDALKRDEAMEGAADKQAEAIQQRKDFDEWFDKTISLIADSGSMHELEILYTTGLVRVNAQGTEDQRKGFLDAKNVRGKALIQAKRAAAQQPAETA